MTLCFRYAAKREEKSGRNTIMIQLAYAKVYISFFKTDSPSRLLPVKPSSMKNLFLYLDKVVPLQSTLKDMNPVPVHGRRRPQFPVAPLSQQLK
jgi:hypothetical protein